MVTDGRTLRGMTRAGYIEWHPQIERHWTGLAIRRAWVRPGTKLNNWYDTFTYRGKEYRLDYVDGCFHPFVFLKGSQRPAFV